MTVFRDKGILLIGTGTANQRWLITLILRPRGDMSSLHLHWVNLFRNYALDKPDG